MTHPFWTPIWFVKFGTATFGGIYVAVTRSVFFGIAFFIGTIIGITILAQILYAMLRMLTPGLIFRWDLAQAHRLLFGKGNPTAGEMSSEEGAEPRERRGPL